MHDHRKKESYHNYNKKLSDETKRKIGIKSKNKFTEEYNKKIRKRMVSLGYWFDNYEFEWIYYNRISNWKVSMLNFVILPNDFNELKMFNKNNTKGYVRDHILSRRDSYLHKLFPEIVRHPCNCQIIKHSENVSKSSSSKITIEELFDKIENYDNISNWYEHDKCLELIKLYRKGERWKNVI